MQTIQDAMLQMNELMTTSFRQLSEFNLKAYDNVVKGQTELANMCVRSNLKQMEVAKGFQNAETYVQNQKDLTQETVEELQTFTKTTVEQATATRDEFIGWMENGIKAAASMNPAS